MNKSEIILNKTLPHNFLAEKMILSCLIINSDAIEITIKTLPVKAFYFKNHQELYQVIILMYKNNLLIDLLSLTTFLQENGLLEKIGGVKVLLELVNNIPNLIYFEEYIRLVKDKFLRRSLIKLGYKIINSGYVTNFPLENILTNLEMELFNLTADSKIPKNLNNVKLLNKLFLELKEKFLNPTLSGLASGFSNLDLLTQGFQKSDLIIIAGRPSIGKTSFSLNITLNIIKNLRLPVLFFSLEMSKEQIMYRILALEMNMSATRLKSGKLYQNDWIKLNKILKILAKLPIFLDDTPSLSILEIRSKLKTILFEQNQIGLVIIDYIQLMQNVEFKTETRVQELSKITRDLKTLAREFNIPIIALSQLSRNVENRIDQKPILSDLRESGSLEQDADLVLMLYRLKSVNSNSASLNTELFIAKQRNGPIGTIGLNFDKKYMRFSDLPK